MRLNGRDWFIVIISLTIIFGVLAALVADKNTTNTDDDDDIFIIMPIVD